MRYGRALERSARSSDVASAFARYDAHGERFQGQRGTRKGAADEAAVGVARERRRRKTLTNKNGQVVLDEWSLPGEVPRRESMEEKRGELQLVTFKHTQFLEMGKDLFDQRVTEFLQRVGEQNIVVIHPISYQHIDMSTLQVVIDYGVIVVYREQQK
jgi:hypothetical protein